MVSEQTEKEALGSSVALDDLLAASFTWRPSFTSSRVRSVAATYFSWLANYTCKIVELP